MSTFTLPFKLPERLPESHKGDYGRILIIAGSTGLTGAAVLAGSSCLRSGAGLVSIASPVSVSPQIAAANASLMTIGLPQTASGKLSLDALPVIKKLAEKYDVIAFGPGVGQSAGLSAIAWWLFSQAPTKVVIDADGLNTLSLALQHKSVRQFNPRSDLPPRVLTPHPGEFQRLWTACGSRLANHMPVANEADSNNEADTEGNTPATANVSTIAQLPANGSSDGQASRFADQIRLQQQAQARALAKHLGCTLVLKGGRSLITDGRQDHFNSTGNPGLATGGSGDCLTGMIAALLVVVPEPFQATALSCYVHGLAADLAAFELGQTAMTSLDLLDFLPAAWQTIGANHWGKPLKQTIATG